MCVDKRAQFRLVRIAGVDRVINSVNLGTGNITFSPGVATGFTSADFAYAQIVNNTTIETGVWNGSVLESIINDDGDGMIESVRRSGGSYEWDASIDSKNIPDGPIELHYVAYDKAGNSVSGSVSSFVANNRPRLAKVRIGTDLSGDGAFSSSEILSFYNPASGEEEALVNLASQTFVVKDKLAIFPEFVGGNGTIRYIWTTNGNPADSWTVGNPMPNTALTGTVSNFSYIPIDGSGSHSAIVIEAGDLSAMDDKLKLFSFGYWDETEETTQGTDSQWARLNAPLFVDVIDGVFPRVAISPFYWNSADDNSLYENKRTNGHLELEADLPNPPFLSTNTSGLFDRDPKVSGKISIRGTAYDDRRLSAIYAFIGDGTTGRSFTFTGSAATKNWGGRTYSRLASYSPSTGTWTGTDRWATDGWKFTVSTTDMSQAGHKIDWQLDLDTSRITGVAALDRYIRIVAEDSYPNASSEAEDLHPGNISQNNRPLYRVDVVPYITKLSTPDRINSGLKDDNIRSSRGVYSIIKGSSANFITVEGFNLNPQATGVRLVNTASRESAVGTTGNSVPFSGVSSDYSSFQLSNNVNNSGYLEVFVNSVRTINNINDNILQSNLEPHLRNQNNLLNDDRYFRFFDMKSTGIKNGYYPTMILEGNDPVFGYVDLTGGPGNNTGIGGTNLVDNGGAGTYQASHAMPQRAKFTAAGGVTYKEYLIKASIWDQMGMARDEAGRFIHATTYNRDGSAMSFIYDRYAELYNNGEGWGSGTSYQNYTGNFSEDANNNALTLESLNYGTLQLGRYQYPKLIAKGNSRTSYASIYMLYFDSNTANKDLIFRNFQIGDNQGGRTNRLFSGGRATDGQSFGQYTNLAENTNNTSTWNTGRQVAGSSASTHFAFDVTSDNIVVIVYYDENDGRLKMRYSNSAVTGSNPTASISWTDSSVSFPSYVGNYVSMKIDSNNGIHISSLDNSDGDLAYMYLPSYNSTALQHITIDAAGQVGNWTQIKLKETGSGASKTIVPYIAYYNSSESGNRESIKLAYSNSGISSTNVPAGVDNSGFVTGNWEFMTVPAITPPQGGKSEFQNVCLDFDSSGKPVVGYLGANIEWGKWLDE